MSQSTIFGIVQSDINMFITILINLITNINLLNTYFLDLKKGIKVSFKNESNQRSKEARKTSQATWLPVKTLLTLLT